MRSQFVVSLLNRDSGRAVGDRCGIRQLREKVDAMSGMAVALSSRDATWYTMRRFRVWIGTLLASPPVSARD